MNICVYGAASNAIDSSFISAGEALGEHLASLNHKIVFGGGAFGMMGAIARGAKRKNGYLIGISPSFFNVDGALFEGCDEMIYTKTMRERKKLLEEKADAFIITAGGIGTFDEFFEILTLRQLSRHSKPIIICNTNNYYSPLIDMLNRAVDGNFVKADNLSLFAVLDTPQDITEYLDEYKPADNNINNYR